MYVCIVLHVALGSRIIFTKFDLQQLIPLALLVLSFCALCPVMHVRPTGLHLEPSRTVCAFMFCGDPSRNTEQALFYCALICLQLLTY